MIYRVMINLIALVLFTTTAYALPQLEGVASDRLLSAEEKTQLRENLKGLISNNLTPVKNDYVDDYNRGTVEYNKEKIYFGDKEKFKQRNYSYHKIDVRNGETIGDYDNYLNFYQKNPDTVISTAKNLTFINANLTNVAVDDSWTLIGCINEQVIYEEEVVDGKTYRIQKNRNRQTGEYEEIERHEIPTE